MRSEGLIEMKGRKKLNFIEVHSSKKNNFLLINKYEIKMFQFDMKNSLKYRYKN